MYCTVLPAGYGPLFVNNTPSGTEGGEGQVTSDAFSIVGRLGLKLHVFAHPFRFPLQEDELQDPLVSYNVPT